MNKQFTKQLEEYIQTHFKDKPFSSLDDFSGLLKDRPLRILSTALSGLKYSGVIKKVGSVSIPRGGSPRALYKYVGRKEEPANATYASDAERYASLNNSQLMLQSALNAMARSGVSR